MDLLGKPTKDTLASESHALGSRDRVLGRNLTTGSGAKSIESGLFSSFPRLLDDDSDEDDNYVSSATSRRGNGPGQLRMDAQRVRTCFQEVGEGKQARVESLVDHMGGAIRKTGWLYPGGHERWF